MSNKERRLPDWINDIQEAIQNIRADLGSLSEESFIGDGKSQCAVIKGLIDIGEAAKNIMSARGRRFHGGHFRAARDRSNRTRRWHLAARLPVRSLCGGRRAGNYALGRLATVPGTRSLAPSPTQARLRRDRERDRFFLPRIDETQPHGNQT